MIVVIELSDDDHGTETERQEPLALVDVWTSLVQEARAGEVDGRGAGDGSLEVFAYGDPDAL